MIPGTRTVVTSAYDSAVGLFHLDSGEPELLGYHDHLALVRVDERLDPSVAELEGALTLDAAIALDGITLADLVDKGGNDLKIIKRGLTFLKAKRFAEALEWFSLHRENLSPSQDRLGLLLLLMEAFTHRLAGDPRRAEQVHARIVAHPVYKKMRGQVRTP
jgi:hypothetical protein